ncbi:MAG TPA: ATP-binding protein [Sandaracinaceae bacterium LLY-WYZ-13_1]|nr:ATP-binding protein [Sandaracinaceae bacterium LLY-WYZ-13_1]
MTSLAGASLIAWAGVYLYVALYYGALQLLRPKVEYRLFAGLAVCLTVFSLASAYTVDAPSPADAVVAEHLQMLGLVTALALFTDFVLRVVGDPKPRVRRLGYTWATVATMAAAARLFHDPAHVDPAYDWGVAGPANRAMAELTPVGAVLLGGQLLFAGYATLRLLYAARARGTLRVAAVLTALGVLGGALDLILTVTDALPVHIASHLAMLPILGFTYVLVGRFTRVDAQLADRTEELAQSYDHLRHAQEELVRKEQLAAVGELSAVIAHELRNPLAIIKNAVAGLRREELRPDDADTLLAILDEEGDRLNRLVNDLLAYAKPISPEPGTVNLRNLTMHAVELAAGGSRDIAQVELELELDREVDDVEGDEALLRHALINIVDNALQAMPDGGTLTVSCRNTELDGRPCVSVDFHDTGEGMDTLVRSRARDPFFTTRQSGTGLGLAIVDRVARAHGGRVELESRHGRGTRVSFVVPRDRSSLAPASS